LIERHREQQPVRNYDASLSYVARDEQYSRDKILVPRLNWRGDHCSPKVARWTTLARSYWQRTYHIGLEFEKTKAALMGNRIPNDHAPTEQVPFCLGQPIERTSTSKEQARKVHGVVVRQPINIRTAGPTYQFMCDKM